MELAADDYEGPIGAHMEAELHHRTVELLENRARCQKDHSFLQHYARAAQLSAVEQHSRGEATTQALNLSVSASWQAREQLQITRQDWSQEKANIQAIRQTNATVGAAIIDVRRHADTEVARLQNLIASEEDLFRTVNKQTEDIRIALQAARSKLWTASIDAQKQRRLSEEAQKDLVQVRADTRQREELVQHVLLTTLQRLEADFARERADHDAHEHRATRRHVLESGLSSLKQEQPRQLEGGEQASLQQAAALQQTADMLAGASSTSVTADLGFLADVRRDLGLPSSQQVLPAFSDNNDCAPSALELQVAHLRRRQEALEAIWSDKSWTHKGTLVKDHIAALAARSVEATAAAADRADRDPSTATAVPASEGMFTTTTQQKATDW